MYAPRQVGKLVKQTFYSSRRLEDLRLKGKQPARMVSRQMR